MGNRRGWALRRPAEAGPQSGIDESTNKPAVRVNRTAGGEATGGFRAAGPQPDSTAPPSVCDADCAAARSRRAFTPDPPPPSGRSCRRPIAHSCPARAAARTLGLMGLTPVAHPTRMPPAPSNGHGGDLLKLVSDGHLETLSHGLWCRIFRDPRAIVQYFPGSESLWTVGPPHAHLHTCTTNTPTPTHTHTHTDPCAIAKAAAAPQPAPLAQPPPGRRRRPRPRRCAGASAISPQSPQRGPPPGPCKCQRTW